MTIAPDAVKVMAKLEVDEDGWPPFGSETFWCEVEPGGYRVNNSPYFVPGVAAGDLISAEQDADGILTFGCVLEPSANSNIWIVFFDEAAEKSCLDALVDLGCDFDGQPLRGYFAVNIPPVVSIAAVEAIIKPFAEVGLIEAAFPTVRHAG